MELLTSRRGLALAIASVLGSYAFTWGFAAFVMASLVGLGVGFHTAETGTLIAAVLVFLTTFIWSFSAAKISTVWVCLVGGGATMIAIAWLIQKMLLA